MTLQDEEEINPMQNMPSSFKPRMAFKQPESKNIDKSQNKELPVSFKSRTELAKNKPESLVKSGVRTLAQIPQAILETTTPGLIASAWQLLAMGEILDPEEIEHIKTVSEREGIPFDEDKYMQAAQRALGTVPTVANIASKVEEKTGLPLEPKTRLEKFSRFATGAGRMIPEAGAINSLTGTQNAATTFRGMTTSLPRPVLGTGVGLAKEALTEAGLPEPISDIASFGVLKQAPKGAGSIEIGKKTKPSGLLERGFEGLKQERTVSSKKLDQINSKVKGDFDKITKSIIEESPTSETFRELVDNPKYKQETRELLQEAQNIADTIPGEHPKTVMQKKLYERAVQGKKQGYKLSEYDREYLNFIGQEMESIKKDKFTTGDLVKTYRENNRELTEMFELGSSKAKNRAKRDAILEHNRAIADVMNEIHPDSELVKVFKEGNDRWMKIMDAEVINEFTSEIFKEGIDFKKAQKFFENDKYARVFKRAFGEEGYKKFQQLMFDFVKSEQSYKMLKVAKENGYKDFYQGLAAYMVNPKLGAAKGALVTGKFLYNKLLNSMLDKPKFMFKFKKTMDNLKQGKFKEAEYEWNNIKEDLQSSKNDVILLGEKPKQLPQKPTEVKPTPQKSLEEKPKVTAKAKEPLKQKKKQSYKPKKYENKPLVQTLEEDLKEAEKKLSERISQVKKEETEGKSPAILKTRKSQLDLMKKRVKDLKEDIAYQKENNPKAKIKVPSEKQVDEKISKIKRQDISKKGLKQQKLYLMDKITEIIQNPTKYEKGQKITIDVPGDGIFILKNEHDFLEKLLKKIESKWPDKAERKPSNTRSKFKNLTPEELKEMRED